MRLIRVHTDSSTVDFNFDNQPGVKLHRRAQELARDGVWVKPNQLWPPHRIVSIEVLTDEEE